MAEKIILHVDFDSFFASVEQQHHPHFRNKPLGVTAANGRTAIIAASREAKALGIKNVMRTYDAFQICPWLVTTSAHFRDYFEISKKFLTIADRYSPTVELFSIDEVFLDVTHTARLFGGVHPLIRLFKKQIAKEIGEYITVSVGISHNKMLAKLASGLKKPNGICEITKENIWNVYQSAKLTDVCGIGYRIAKRLNTIGIYSLLQLRDMPIETLLAEFGTVEGTFLKHVGLGIDDDEVISYTKARDVKSVSRNYCLPKNEYDKRIIYQNIFALSEEIALKLRRLKKKSQTIGISLRGSQHFYARKTVTEYLDTGNDIFAVCNLFLHAWDIDMVRMISVWAGSLQDADATPLSLFDTQGKKTKLQQSIDAINNKFGSHTIHNGFLLYADKLTTTPNGFMVDTYERKKLANDSYE
jgi:DNA polymerase IV